MYHDYIREFSVLAEMGNFTDAADALFISQPTLSRHMKAFETELGVPLFTRTPKNVYVNEYGKLFLPYAQKINEVEDECIQNFMNELRVTRELIRVGVFTVDTPYEFSDWIVEYRLQHPDISINLLENTTGNLIKSVECGVCDFAIIFDQGETVGHDLYIQPLDQDVYNVVVPSNHPLAQNDTVSFAQLNNETFIIQDDICTEYYTCLNLAQEAGFLPNVSFQNVRIKNLIRLVELGQGITIRPQKTSIFHTDHNTKSIRITPDVVININLIYSSSRFLTDKHRELIGFLTEKVQKALLRKI